MQYFIFILAGLFLLCDVGIGREYLKIPKMDLPWASGPRVGNCGDDKNVPCNITYLSEQCDNTAYCNGFNANGFLKLCYGNRCGCSLSPSSCPMESNITDLYLQRGIDPPSKWKNGILNGSILYDSLLNNISTESLCYEPEIGNGYLSVNINWNAMYIAGLFNGKCGSVHKARLPSTILITLNNATLIANGIDLKRAMFIKQWQLNYNKDIVIEQRFLVHRKRRNILIMQLLIDSNNGKEDMAAVQIFLNDSFSVNKDDISADPGNGCAGSFTNDFNFIVTQKGNYTTKQPMIYYGTTLIPDDDGNKFNVSFVKDVIPQIITLYYNQTQTFLTSIVTSIPADINDALTEYNAAIDVMKNNNNQLISEHENEWSVLYESGIDIWPNDNDQINEYDLIGFNGIGLNFHTANNIVRHLNSSLYYLYSSIRTDWFPGVSPGGISTQNYQGAVFFDMDWYISPSFFLINPNISETLLEYRYISINESLNIAQLFGYNGSMYAWTAAYLGRPFGCCTGKGGYEDCLEQHITGDIGVTTWNYYISTQNKTWLKYRGWPLLENIANWIISRITPKPTLNDNTNTIYNINDVLPVDEWCVGAGCGCETPGVNNDIQTNSVCKLSLKYAVMAAEILNITESDNIKLYKKVFPNIPILFNNSHNRHTQFDSSLCPNGYGGSNYSPHHTVCPEDAMYLSYPLGNALNLSMNVTNNDYNYYEPITCKENAGMTTPIHSIIQLSLASYNMGNNNYIKAEEVFNRSMYAACYGPYNVRNEVDKHLNIIGGHFDNTHFLTGNGGFLQQFVYGFSGLKIVDNGLKLEKPYLPEVVGKMQLRKLKWRNFNLNILITKQLNVTIDAKSDDGDKNICLLDNKNNVIPLSNSAFNINANEFAYPGLLFNSKC